MRNVFVSLETVFQGKDEVPVVAGLAYLSPGLVEHLLSSQVINASTYLGIDSGEHALQARYRL